MPTARLNFADHPDGTFSCQAVWLGDYDPSSPSHQNVRILEAFINGSRFVAPEDGTDEIADAARPTLETEAHMMFRDEGEAFRLHLEYLPKARGFVAGSPAHEACMLAHSKLEYLNRAVSDALVTRAGSGGVVSVVAKERINWANGN